MNFIPGNSTQSPNNSAQSSDITQYTDELAVDLKFHSAIVNVDLVTTIEHVGSRILSTKFELFEIVGSTTRILNLFELTYDNQVFIMKQIGINVRKFGNHLPEGTAEPINDKTLGSSRMY